MKSKKKDEYKCLVNCGLFVVQISVSVIMMLIAIIIICLAIGTENTNLMVIEWIAVILSILSSFFSILSAMREVKRKFIIDKNFCILNSTKNNVCLSVSEIQRIEVINVFRGAKKIIIYGSEESLQETSLNDDMERQIISLQYSKRREKMIKKYCINSTFICKGWS